MANWSCKKIFLRPKAWPQYIRDRWTDRHTTTRTNSSIIT